MAISDSNYTQTTVAAPVAPSTSSVFDIAVQAPFIRELVANGIVDEPKMSQELTSAMSFFNGQTLLDTSFLLNNVKFGQEVRVNIKKDQNPFDLFQKSTLEYDAVDSCHDQLQLDCTVPCINTLPTFAYIKFRFDTEYAYGVRYCDKNKDFYNFDLVSAQYAASRSAKNFGRETDLWNTVVKGIIAAPATTVDAALAATAGRNTHYWANGGAVATNGRALVSQAYYYLTSSFQGLNPTVFIAPEFATELIKSVENPYNLDLSTQRVNTFEDYEIPGFQLSSAVSQILGGIKNVVIMKRSPWMTYGTGTLTSQYPLWATDGTKQYVVIADPRVGFQFAKEGYSLDIKPYDCDKLVAGMVDTEYVGSGITFPQYAMVLEFDPFNYS